MIRERQAELDQVLAAIFPVEKDVIIPPALATGDHPALESADELLDTARNASNGAAFSALFDKGECSNPSEGDLGLCNMLAFYAGPDPTTIDRLFRLSALMRAKWDEKRGEQTYGAMTIAKALAGRTEFYGAVAAAGEEESLFISVVTAAEFSAVDEPGAEPLVGEGDEVVIPAGGDAMVYGEGGAGKTTLSIDLGAHLAAGENWLGFHIKNPVNVLLVEGEGPRPLFRKKLKRKLTYWAGKALDNRLKLLDEPWAKFTFNSEVWRTALAKTIAIYEVDVLIVGPLSKIGMDGAGTLEQVADFMRLVDKVRDDTGRALTVILIHHENKGGAVSGAWEGAGDTLMHVAARGNGYTDLTFEKARWASATHGTVLKLAWIEGEGFRIKTERDLLSEIVQHLRKGPATLEGIRQAIKADRKLILEEIKSHESRFVLRTGAEAVALGKSEKAKVYELSPNGLF